MYRKLSKLGAVKTERNWSRSERNVGVSCMGGLLVARVTGCQATSRIHPNRKEVAIPHAYPPSRKVRNPNSKGARRSSDRPIPRPDTVAPSAARRRAGGGRDRPADSIGERPMDRRNVRRRAGVTGVVAPSVGGRPKLKMPPPRARKRHVGARFRRARVSAQRTIPDFFAAIDR